MMPKALQQMGYLLTLRGRPVEALAWLDRAVRLDPIHPPWYNYDRSLALYSIGDYAGAAGCHSTQPRPAALDADNAGRLPMPSRAKWNRPVSMRRKSVNSIRPSRRFIMPNRALPSNMPAISSISPKACSWRSGCHRNKIRTMSIYNARCCYSPAQTSKNCQN